MHCGINMLCFVLKLFFGWIFRTLGKCSEYPDTHIKVLTKEHFNNRCLHSENNGSHKAPSGTLERRKQSQNHISALSAEWDLSVPHLSTIARGDGCDQAHRCPVATILQFFLPSKVLRDSILEWRRKCHRGFEAISLWSSNYDESPTYGIMGAFLYYKAISPCSVNIYDTPLCDYVLLERRQ